MPTVTLAEIQQDVYDQLEQNTILYTLQQVTNVINEGYRIINGFTGLNQATVSVPGFSVAGQLIYQSPSPILFPLECYFEGKQLRKMSLGALARTYRGWAADLTNKSGPVQRWAPIGITRFVIHPQDAVGGRDIAITGVTEPTPLVNAGDSISIPDEYLTMLISYVSHRIRLKEGGKVFSDASLLLQQFYRDLKRLGRFQTAKFPSYWILTGPVQ